MLDDDLKTNPKNACPLPLMWLVSFSDTDDRQLDANAIRRAVAGGELSPRALVWREGMLEWRELATLAEFKDMIERAPMTERSQVEAIVHDWVTAKPAGRGPIAFSTAGAAADETPEMPLSTTAQPASSLDTTSGAQRAAPHSLPKATAHNTNLTSKLSPRREAPAPTAEDWGIEDEPMHIKPIPRGHVDATEPAASKQLADHGDAIPAPAIPPRPVQAPVVAREPLTKAGAKAQASSSGYRAAPLLKRSNCDVELLDAEGSDDRADPISLIEELKSNSFLSAPSEPAPSSSKILGEGYPDQSLAPPVWDQPPPSSSAVLGHSHPDQSLAPPAWDQPPPSSSGGSGAPVVTPVDARLDPPLEAPRPNIRRAAALQTPILVQQEKAPKHVGAWVVASLAVIAGGFFSVNYFTLGAAADSTTLAEPPTIVSPPTPSAVSSASEQVQKVSVSAPASPAPAQSAEVASSSQRAASNAPERQRNTPKTAASPVEGAAAGPGAAGSVGALTAGSASESETREPNATTAPEVEPSAPAEPERDPSATSDLTAANAAGSFDKTAAMAALNEAARKASACRKDGDPSGAAQVSVTFVNSGRATRALLNGPPFAGTATGGCIAEVLRGAQIPAFSGDKVTVSKRVIIH